MVKDLKKEKLLFLLHAITDDTRIIEAFARIPREEFIPPETKDFAYTDAALPIGYEQTISQPSLVCKMIDLLELDLGARTLEVGSGSGYAAAILSKVAKEVIAIERIKELVSEAQERLTRLKIRNVKVIEADGSLGWHDAAPFDAILVSAGAKEIPTPLCQQLKIGGTMVIPVGKNRSEQMLTRVKKLGPESFEKEELLPVAFVPLI